MTSESKSVETRTAPTLSLRVWLRRISTTLLVLVGVFALWIASDIEVPTTLAPLTGRLQGFVTVFLGIFVEALPFLTAGVLVSSIIHLYVSEDLITRYTPHNPVLAALGGSVLGLAFPVCECGSIPAARRLMSKGAALPVGIAFVLAAPVINPIVIISTFVAFNDWGMVGWRIGLTMLIAVTVALLVGGTSRIERVLTPALVNRIKHDHADHDHADHDHATCAHDHHHDDHDHHHHHHDDPQAGVVRRVLGHASGEFFEMARFLIIGAMLAAALQTLVPQQAILALGNGPIVSILVMMGLAVVLSVCSTVDSFIALSFVNTFTPGAIIAFLVFGPMIDIKSTLMLTSTFRRTTVALIILLTAQLSLLAGILINFYL